MFSASSLSTFSLSFTSSCLVVSMQYSAVHSILHVWHCSSSVNLMMSPSFSRLWIRLLADAIVGCCRENRSSCPDKLSCLLILQQSHVTTVSCGLSADINRRFSMNVAQTLLNLDARKCLNFRQKNPNLLSQSLGWYWLQPRTTQNPKQPEKI